MQQNLETMVFTVSNPEEYIPGRDAYLVMQSKSSRGHYVVGNEYFTEVRIESVNGNQVAVNYIPIPELFEYALFHAQETLFSSPLSKFDRIRRLKEKAIVTSWKPK